MSKQFKTRTSKKRSFSDLPKKFSDTFNFSKSIFRGLGQTQLIQALTQRDEKNIQLSKDRLSIGRQLLDQKGENEGLRKSIKQAMDKMKIQRKQSYVTKDQLFVITEDRGKLQRQNKSITSQLLQLQQKYIIAIKQAERFSLQKQKAQNQSKQLQAKFGDGFKKSQKQLKHLKQQNKRLSKIALDQGLAVQRIKILQSQLRQIKLDKNFFQITIARLTKQLQQSQNSLKQTKPQLQRQIQRVKYYQHFVKDLQKKSEHFFQKQYQMNRQRDRLMKQIQQIESSNDSYKKMYKEGQQKLNTIIKTLKQTQQKLNQTEEQLSSYVIKCQSQTINIQDFQKKIKQLQQTILLKQQQISRQSLKIQFLQQHHKSIKQSIAQAKYVSAESNKFVLKRDMQAYKLKQDKEFLQKKIDQLSLMFKKFDEFYLQSSIQSKNKLRDSVVSYIKNCSKIEIEMNQLKKSLQAKDLQYMQLRDMLQRDLVMKQENLTKDANLYEKVFAQKNDQIRVLQNSNSQLLKSAAGLQDVVITLQQQNTRFEIQINEQNFTIVQLQKLQKQNIQLRMKQKENQRMIEVLKKQNKQTQEQLFKKVDQLTNAKFKIDSLQKQISEQLTQIDTLNNKINIKLMPIIQPIVENKAVAKQSQERMSIEMKQKLMLQAIDKMSNALKSIELYFSCGFCQKIVVQPWSVLPCGHHFCHSCTQGFKEDCYECGNGMPLQGVFRNIHLESALPRLRFFTMVFQNVSKVFEKQKHPIK